MKTSIIYTVIFITLYGCATSEKIVGPDGSTHQLITCDSIKYCYEEARKVCGGNYKIMNTSSETGNAGNVVVTETNLLIKCEK